MNQENNNLNNDNFNTQGNSVIPNNQNMNINQQPINPQPQATPSFEQPVSNLQQTAQQPQSVYGFQQPIMQEPISHHMNNFGSGSVNNQGLNNEPTKKKNLWLIIGIAVIVVLVGVGIVFGSKLFKNNNTNDNKNKRENIDINNNQSGDKLQQTDKNSVKSAFTSKYKVPLKKIVVDIPEATTSSISGKVSYQPIENGYTQLYVVGRERYIAITSARDSVASNLRDAYNITIEMLIEALENYTSITKVEIEKESKTTINQTEVYRFEGYFINTSYKEFKQFMVGYSFIKDGIPCSIIGSILDISQNPDDINIIKNDIDYMITTLRDEK